MSSGFYENRRTGEENGHHRRIRLMPPLFTPSDATTNLPVQNPRRRTHDVWLPYQERPIRHPFPFTRVPLHSPHVHVFVLDHNDNVHGILGVPHHHHHHHLSGQQQVPTIDHHRREESKLSEEEQKNALSKLRKETYNPSVVKKTYKPNYYVRNWDIIFSRQEKLDKDEDGKNCAICLEDFEAKEDVTLTPCNHMFHEDCIVPWVKSHGLCPVCRFTIFERVIGDGVDQQPQVANNNADYERARNYDDLFGRELISVIRAMHGGVGAGGGFRSNMG